MSLPAFPTRSALNSEEQVKRNVNFSKRPLPLTPGLEETESQRITNVLAVEEQMLCERRKMSECAHKIWKKEPLRRKTFDNSITLKTKFKGQLSVLSYDTTIEDHIYEEINEEQQESNDIEEDIEENQFLNLISSKRRKNLIFYGSAGWDFGTEITEAKWN